MNAVMAASTIPSGTSCALDPHGIGIHVKSNVADQHQTAAGQCQRAAVGPRARCDQG